MGYGGGFVPPDWKPPIAVRPPTIPPGSIGRAYKPQNLTANRRVKDFLAMRRDNYLNESPISVIEGESLVFTVTYEGVTTVATPSVTAYKDGTDVTSTIFPTNSPTASGNVVTLSAATGFVGPARIVVAIKATCDNSTETRKLILIVSRDEDE